MTVSRRKNSKYYYYDFTIGNQRYKKVCKGCTTKAAAEKFEKEVKARINKLSQQDSLEQLVVNFKHELSHSVEISLREAFDYAMKKPKKRAATEKHIKLKQLCWLDFVAFMEETYPDIKAMDQVEPHHAEAYIQYIRTKGRFKKTVTYTVKGKERSYEHANEQLSGRTLNVYHQTLTEIFSLLHRDAGLLNNPFSTIPRLELNSEPRDAFTEEELQKIRDKADVFILPLFILAISTALREGDICTLRWDDVDLDHKVITKKMNKTKHTVEIPMMPPLETYLKQLHAQRGEGEYSEYVLPEHAKMYLTNNSGVSYRIKKFLEGSCGIVTTKKVEGRARAVSVKDLHSCRHTFCYYAGLCGIPLAVVQSIVGHMSPEMTKHYSAHATISDKREMMKNMPEFLSLAPEPQQQLPENTEADAERKALIALIQSLPEEAVTILLETARRLSSNPATDTP